MSSFRSRFVPLAAAAVLATGLGASAYAQMGGQMSGHQHGAMQGATQAAAQGSMTSAQAMRNVDTMMNSVTAMMRTFTSLQPGTFGAQHDQMMSSVRGLNDQMHQFHGTLGTMAADHALMHNADASKAFQQACTNFEKMGAALQDMMKNLNQVGKGLPNGAK